MGGAGAAVSPPLALFIVMLSEANLTSDCRISGSMLEKTLECPLDCKEIKPANPTENQL